MENCKIVLQVLVIAALNLNNLNTIQSILAFRGCRAPYLLTVSMRAVVRAWKVTRRDEIKDDGVVFFHMLLWKNLPTDPILWTTFGIKMVVW